MQLLKNLNGLTVVVLAALLCGCGSEPEGVSKKTEETKAAPANTTVNATPANSTVNAAMTAEEADSILAGPKVEIATDLERPVRLEAGGRPLDVTELGSYGHASPWIADVDCDGDEDLLVGDFPGYFWFCSNEGTDEKPEYASAVKLQAGGEDAKVPVY